MTAINVVWAANEKKGGDNNDCNYNENDFLVIKNLWLIEAPKGAHFCFVLFASMAVSEFNSFEIGFYSAQTNNSNKEEGMRIIALSILPNW